MPTPWPLGEQTDTYDIDACAQDIRGAASKGLVVEEGFLEEVNPGRRVGVLARQKQPRAGTVCANVKRLDTDWTHTWAGVYVGIVVTDGVGGEAGPQSSQSLTCPTKRFHFLSEGEGSHSRG